MFLSEAFGHCLAIFVLALSQEAQKLHNLAQKACEDRESMESWALVTIKKGGHYPLNFGIKTGETQDFPNLFSKNG